MHVSQNHEAEPCCLGLMDQAYASPPSLLVNGLHLHHKLLSGRDPPKAFLRLRPNPQLARRPLHSWMACQLHGPPPGLPCHGSDLKAPLQHQPGLPPLLPNAHLYGVCGARVGLLAYGYRWQLDWLPGKRFVFALGGPPWPDHYGQVGSYNAAGLIHA